MAVQVSRSFWATIKKSDKVIGRPSLSCSVNFDYLVALRSYWTRTSMNPACYYEIDDSPSCFSLFLSLSLSFSVCKQSKTFARFSCGLANLSDFRRPFSFSLPLLERKTFERKQKFTVKGFIYDTELNDFPTTYSSDPAGALLPVKINLFDYALMEIDRKF